MKNNHFFEGFIAGIAVVLIVVIAVILMSVI